MGFLDFFKTNDTPVVKNVIIINTLFLLGTIAFPSMSDYLGMHYWNSEKFNLAQMISYMFMHGGFSHLFFNMFAVYMFGVVIEQVWGSRRFLIYYLITGIGAGLIQQLVWTVEYQPILSALSNGSVDALAEVESSLRRYFSFSQIENFNSSDLRQMSHSLSNLPVTVGASGAVFGILLAFGWLFPEVKLMLIFFPVPIKARIFVILYAVAELFLGVANFSGDSVAHFAHLGGMIFGVILILYWRKKGSLFNKR